MNVLSERLQNVLSRVAIACAEAGRSESEVRLLAVSKTQPVEAIRSFKALGQDEFGENRLQDAMAKQPLLADSGICWHFIGPVQSNKTRDVAARFDWVQSVDREKILRRLALHRPSTLPALNVCLQVNIDNEPQKAGLSAGELPAMAELVEDLDGVVLRGLMCIPRFTPESGALHASFSAVKACYDQLRGAGHDLDTLSMGMSGDLEIAIAEGSTMIRVGTDLFGPRVT